MRLVGGFNRAGQDAMVARLVELFDQPDRRPRVVDRREHPSYGYTAVHVIAVVRSVPVEIQVRTQLQHEWADLFEKLADRVGRDIRYGKPPDHWMASAEREEVSSIARKRYDIDYALRALVVERALIVARMIGFYERAEQRHPEAPQLPEYRSRVDGALAGLRKMLDQL